jgi:hypothetical protein
VTGQARVASSTVPIASLEASDEALRRVALGRADPDDGPSLGFTVLLHQGMPAWLRAWAMCPRPSAHVPRAAPLVELPSILHTELARVWAHMALSHEEAAWI